MNYLEVAKSALREYQDAPAPKAQEAPKGSMPLPPQGDPRRLPIELIDEVWACGCWLVIDGDRVRAVPRDPVVPSERLTTHLMSRVEAHQSELLRTLTRIPDCREARQSPQKEITPWNNPCGATRPASRQGAE